MTAILLDYIIHVDAHLQAFLQAHGPTTYALLFLIIFIETGVVIFPFLPGDSLIFIAGTFCANGWLSLPICFGIFVSAAILGDNVNRFLGRRFGRKIFRYKYILTVENLKKTEDFFAKHGTKTVILARFLPFFRTFVPFVAGIGEMEFKKFFIYDAIGGIAWVSLFLFAGYFFGNVPIIKHNLSIAILVILVASVLPAIYHFVRDQIKKRKDAK